MRKLLAMPIALAVGILTGLILKRLSIHGFDEGYILGGILMISYFVSLILLTNTN